MSRPQPPNSNFQPGVGLEPRDSSTYRLLGIPSVIDLRNVIPLASELDDETCRGNQVQVAMIAITGDASRQLSSLGSKKGGNMPTKGRQRCRRPELSLPRHDTEPTTTTTKT